MAISMCVVALPSILPAYSKLSKSNQVTKYYPNVVAPTRSDKLSSLVPCSQPKASRTVFQIVRSLSEKDDAEIEAQLKRLQNTGQMLKGFLGDCILRLQDTVQMLKGFWGDCILVLMALNPITQLFADSNESDTLFVSQCSLGAFYGASILSKECAKVLWKSQPNWAFITVGFLIYKANMFNIALHRNGHHPVWAGKPLTVLACGKLLADCLLLLTSSKRTPLNMILRFHDCKFQSPQRPK